MALVVGMVGMVSLAMGVLEVEGSEAGLEVVVKAGEGVHRPVIGSWHLRMGLVGPCSQHPP